MDLRERLKKIFISAGMQTPGWETPTWNNPAGSEFNAVQCAMESAYLKLLDIEAALDETTQSNLSNELGAEYTAGGALKTHARFTSDEWLAAWREFLSAVQRADDASTSWQKYVQEKS